MRDQLPRKRSPEECGVINLDTSKTSGTHWTCYFLSPEKCIYFDSYGLPPPIELVNYTGRGLYYNTFILQDTKSPICGHLCLFVLSELSKGKSFFDIVLNLYELCRNKQ